MRMLWAPLLGICVLCGVAAAQPLFWLGANAGYGWNVHRGALEIVPGSSRCGTFSGGSGVGISYGLAFELPLAVRFRLSARALFSSLGGTLTAQLDNGLEVYDPASRSTVPLVRSHTYDATLEYAGLDLLARYAPFDFPLGFMLGPSVGLPLFARSFTEQERIVSPQGYVYPNGTKTIVDSAGAIAQTNTRIAIAGGAGYDLPIGRFSALSPEIILSYPLTNIISGMQWKVFAMRAGITVKFGIQGAPPPAVVPPPPPPAPVPPPKPVASLSAQNAADIHIVETTVTQTYPILPYIFFDVDSSAIPPRYSMNGGGFREYSLPDNAMAIYHNILDLTGERLAADPGNITLTGTTDDEGVERGDLALAHARAESVKRYLVEVWGIDSARISVRARLLPEDPTDTSAPEGSEENRRVEISGGGPGLFKPVVHANFSEYSMTPPKMTFALGAQAQSGIASWSLEARRGEEPFAAFGGNGAPPAQFSWTLPDSLARIFSDTDRILCSLTVRDSSGGVTVSTHAVPVYKKKNTVEIGRLSLIVFDFDKADIGARNRAMMRQFVATALQPASTVSIVGSTDRLGEAAHNQELSDARAQHVKDLLLAIKPDADIIECKGIGQSNLQYDNALPEGRYYCRTVAITVRTPVNATPHGD